MSFGKRRLLCAGLLVVLAALCISGCRQKRPLPYPPGSGTGAGGDAGASATPPAPTIRLAAEPASVPYGSSATLSWTTTDADAVTIDAVGTFPAQGSAVIKPEDTTEYRAVATGRGGRAEATATVEVTGKPPAVPDDGTSGRGGIDELSLEEQAAEIFRTEIKDVYFDFDRHDLRDSDKDILRANSKVLQEKLPKVKIVIEGHCDERGSEEYNLALGDKRATSVRDFLVSLGVESARIRTISYGKEKPFDPGKSEDAYSKNRRAHFVLVK